MSEELVTFALDSFVDLLSKENRSFLKSVAQPAEPFATDPVSLFCRVDRALEFARCALQAARGSGCLNRTRWNGRNSWKGAHDIAQDVDGIRVGEVAEWMAVWNAVLAARLRYITNEDQFLDECAKLSIRHRILSRWRTITHGQRAFFRRSDPNSTGEERIKVHPRSHDLDAGKWNRYSLEGSVALLVPRNHMETVDHEAGGGNKRVIGKRMCSAYGMRLASNRAFVSAHFSHSANGTAELKRHMADLISAL